VVEPRELKAFLEIPYDELEERNLSLKQKRLDRVEFEQIASERRKELSDEKRVKAITVCFTDLEGRFHMLDYDKKFLLKSEDNLTFDGSSIRGFSHQHESDLRLAIDWPSFFWLPSDVFGPGKVLVFSKVLNRDGTPYGADLRGRLQGLADELWKKDQTLCHAANEIEGFIFQGRDAERHYHQTGKFEFISTGGYYHSLPNDPLRQFIDRAAEAQRAMGFQNEKDHPEVAPAQFEMNYSFTEVVAAADQIQLYKLIARQVASNLGLTACFLPKPVTGVNGSGMHTNLSLNRKRKNLFYDKAGEDGLSASGWDFVDRVLNSANDMCLVLNSSVNSYRRLDPAFEAPNQIKASAINRGAMVRIPLGNERSTRIEVRSIAPDANPYLALYTVLRVGLEGPPTDPKEKEGKRERTRFLPDNIQDAIRNFKQSTFMAQLLGEDVQQRYAELKQMAADRCPKALGTMIKPGEVTFHHEVTNQLLWSLF
jgi:glutamine synthetase